MDREVAAGWFDETLLDLEYKFKPFLHNVPDRSSLKRSRRESDEITTNFSNLSEDLVDIDIED